MESRDFGFSNGHFKTIAELAYRKFGLNLPDSKESLVYSRLVKRLRALQLDSFDAYCALLSTDQGRDEQKKLLSALTTNVSHFFREPHHFEILKQQILPRLISGAKSGQRARLWSAGCSTGQEPYSIAMTVLDMCPDIAKYDFKILATDVDPEVLHRAKAGIYSGEVTENLSSSNKTKFFEKRDDATSEIVGNVKALISFAELNLINSWPLSGKFDAIMCRNVAIYFDRVTQDKLWMRFYEHLAPDGALFIGHSERLSNDVAQMTHSIGVTAFQKSATT